MPMFGRLRSGPVISFQSVFPQSLQRSILLAGFTSLALPSCTIDFDAPFNESGWYAVDASSKDAQPDSDAAVDVRDDVTADTPDSQGDTETGEADPCTDGLLGDGETDIDCGSDCPPCRQGDACVSGADCLSNFCVDGVCCESACTDRCRACVEDRTNEADGTCAFIVSGTDPDNECSGGYDCRLGDCESCNDGEQNGDETLIDCGGVCPPCSENCTNGADDDGNGLVDCEDPGCGSYVCMPTVPNGWAGPALYYEGAPAFPDCSNPIGTGAVGQPLFAPALCSECTCGAPTGYFCPPPRVELFDASSCGTAPDINVTPPGPNTCAVFQDLVEYDSARAIPAPVSGGSCTASGGVPDLGTVDWQNFGQLCSAETATGGGGCGGNTCVPAPPAPYFPRFCVFHPGEVSCPAPGSSRFVLFTASIDTRDCSPCACSDPVGSCEGTVLVYGSTTCTGSNTSVPIDGACRTLSAGATNYESLRYYDYGAPGTACVAAGGEPVGDVQGTDPVTVCCF